MNNVCSASFMRFTFKQLKKFSVDTVSGTHLGKVQDVVLDSEGQLVLQYVVNSALIGGQEYLISRDSVVRFEENKLIVDDGIVKVQKEPVSLSPLGPQVVPGVSMRELKNSGE